MQHAVDVNRGDRRALQRRQQNPAQRVAERLAETAFERLSDDGRHPPRGLVQSAFELLRLDEFLPVLLDHWSPLVPGDDHEIVLPCASVMVIIVLLKVEFTCATPETMFLRSRRRTRVPSFAIGSVPQSRFGRARPVWNASNETAITSSFRRS